METYKVVPFSPTAGLLEWVQVRYQDTHTPYLHSVSSHNFPCCMQALCSFARMCG